MVCPKSDADSRHECVPWCPQGGRGTEVHIRLLCGDADAAVHTAGNSTQDSVTPTKIVWWVGEEPEEKLADKKVPETEQ